MILIFLGPQGSGKGTQAKLLVKKLGCHYLEIGDVLREKAEEKSSLGQEINRFINQEGKLVPENIMKKIVADWLNKVDFGKGIIFDGYPRNLEQYRNLQGLLTKKGKGIDLVIYLKLSRTTSIKRLSARRICPRCNLEYNLVTKPPRKEGLCDRCQGKLIQRKDDFPQLIKGRLDIYYRLTQPLIDSVRKEGILEEVDGERSIEVIHQDIKDRIKKYQAAGK